MNIILSYTDPTGKDDFYRQILPSGLASISSLLSSKGFNCRVANFSSLDTRSIEKFILESSPHIFGISVFTHNRKASRKLAEIVREISPSTFIICGGPHATFCPEEILSWGVDGVVSGEGELTLLDIAVNMAECHQSELPDIPGLMRKGRHFTQRNLIENLDELPYPHRGLKNAYNVDIYEQSRFLITSRGCPASCSFCSSPNFWGRKLRFRSAGSVLSEMRALRKELGIINLDIRDDTFTSDRKRAFEICSGMIEQKLYFLWSCQSRVNYVDFELIKQMKLAGCEAIQFGIESGSARIRDILEKKITDSQIVTACSAVRKAGMKLSVYLMAGIPGETDNDAEITAKMLQSIKPHDGQVSPLAYFPGTELYNKWIKTSGSSVLSAEAVAYYADKKLADKNTAYLMKSLNRVLRKTGYTEADLQMHQKTTGFSFAGKLMSAERSAESGDISKAKNDYFELIQKEPQNHWGWLLLAELQMESGDLVQAEKNLLKANALIPANIETIKDLIEIYLIEGNYKKAEEQIKKLGNTFADSKVASRYNKELKKLKKGLI